MKTAKKTNKKKASNGQYILALIFAIAVFVGSIVCMSAIGKSDDVPNPPPSTTTKKTDTATTETKGVSTTQTVTTEPVTTQHITTEVVTTTEPVTTESFTTEPVTTEPVVTEPVTTEPVTTEAPITTQTPETTTGPVDTTDSPVTTDTEVATSGPITDEPVYPMPERPAVEDSFFDDVLFVGDSRTQGIQLYGNIRNATYYADQGLNVVTAMQRNFINEGGESLNIVDAIKRHPEFKKIYICFGVNEYWMAGSVYKNNYEILIDAIKAAAAPDAKIFIYSVFPLADGLANSEYGLNNDKMAEFNAISLEIAREKGLYYIDVSEAFLKPDGRRYLDSNDSSDGIHLNGQGTLRLCEYIRTHTRYEE